MDASMNTLALVVAAVVMAVGVVGTVLPLVPGIGLIWAAGLVYGLVAGFEDAGTVAFLMMTALAGTGTAAKVILPHRTGAAAGASRADLALGAAPGIVGFFVIPVVGLPLGAAAGVLVAQYHRTGDCAKARRATKGVIVGFGKGALAEFAAAIAMVACWVGWVLAP